MNKIKKTFFIVLAVFAPILFWALYVFLVDFAKSKGAEAGLAISCVACTIVSWVAIMATVAPGDY